MKKCSIFGATVPLLDAKDKSVLEEGFAVKNYQEPDQKDKSLPVIFVHMTPQGVATSNKLLAILTIVSRRYVLAFDVFIQMSPIDG